MKIDKGVLMRVAEETGFSTGDVKHVAQGDNYLSDQTDKVNKIQAALHANLG